MTVCPPRALVPPAWRMGFRALKVVGSGGMGVRVSLLSNMPSPSWLLLVTDDDLHHGRLWALLTKFCGVEAPFDRVDSAELLVVAADCNAACSLKIPFRDAARPHRPPLSFVASAGTVVESSSG